MIGKLRYLFVGHNTLYRSSGPAGKDSLSFEVLHTGEGVGEGGEGGGHVCFSRGVAQEKSTSYIVSFVFLANYMFS